ncbi:MAG TPA: methyltransferase [Flavobacteriaceae bacterium]|nr:methyltransferase [Flavobacteriaceae bacterium]
MKIGTDGVLLGAWASIENQPKDILDIGTGTGIIALQLAQRSSANRIDALEIDKNAFDQCTGNFKNSPWNDRLHCFHSSFQHFLKEEKNLYDLIVSNPPFYREDYSSGNEKRDLARFSSSITFEELLKGTAQLLSERGIFSTIIPKSRETEFTQLASTEKLHLQKRTKVRGNKNSKIKRSLLQFGFEKTTLFSNQLIVEHARHEYTEEYRALVEDFYLKM